MSVTIKNIAELADVSTTTVSKVLNNKDGISDETRNRILKIINECNYKPSAIARGMVTKKTKTIGLIIPDICNPFYPDLARGVEDGASKSNYSVFLCNTDNHPQKEKDYMGILIEKCVDGIIFTSSLMPDERNINELERLKIPFIYLDRIVTEDKNVNGIYVNNVKGGYDATKYLLKLGHRKIACVTGNLKTFDAVDRLEGYKRALKDFNVEFDETLIENGNYDIESGYDCVKKLAFKKRIGKDVTAIFLCNDLMACGAYRYLKSEGYNIPKDVSIVGFDDIQISQFIEPGLTTIRQPMYDMGSFASKMIINIIKGRKSKKAIKILEPKLVVRQSTMKINI